MSGRTLIIILNSTIAVCCNACVHSPTHCSVSCIASHQHTCMLRPRIHMQTNAGLSLQSQILTLLFLVIRLYCR